MLAPVNAVAKKITDEIEPLAAAQKIFETALIHQLRGAAILTELEAQPLIQLNSQRNKAAHPSGHAVTAEEARYMFSEAIQKFLSKPLRETSYVVDYITEKIGDQNFFPSSNMNDKKAVADQEIANLDIRAMPFLIAKLIEVQESTQTTAVNNATNFLLVLASRRNPEIRASIIKKLIEPKSSKDQNAEFFSMLVNVDPEILVSIDVGTRLRYRALLLRNANTIGFSNPYMYLRNPVSTLGSCISVLGETVVLAEMKDFADLVIGNSPYAPEFIAAVGNSP